MEINKPFERTHQELDARSLALHCLVAAKLQGDPSLFARVQETLARWRTIVSPNSQPYLDEWERLIQRGMAACLAVATENSEHATALRQASPFCGILTNKERFAFLKTWSQEHESTGT